MNRKTISSIITNLLSFGIQLFISLFITPVIINKVGTSAYGFIGLANDFTIYLSLITHVLNSVSGRFIAVALYKNQISKANSYFNSVLVVNIGLSVLFMLIGLIFIPNLQFFLDIPPHLVMDVKLTFVFTLFAYILNIMVSIYTTATFVKDRLDIQGIRNVFQYAFRGLLIVCMFAFLPAKIYWLSVATLCVAFLLSFFDVHMCQRLMPELNINIKNFRKSSVKELASSGSLLAITNLSSVLLSGLDLLIANLLLGSYRMGILSAAKTLPANLSNAVVIVASLFTPAFVGLYTKGKLQNLQKELCNAMKMIAFVLFVPLTGFMVFSYDFYALWLHGKAAKEITLITILSNIIVIESFFNAITFPLAQMSLVANKMRLPVAISFGVGISNTFIVLILLKFTEFGLYAIASVSTVLLVLRYLLFNPWYAGHILHINAKLFYTASYKIYATIPLLAVFFYMLKQVFKIDNWISFGISAVFCGCMGYLLMGILLYGKTFGSKIVNAIHNSTEKR